MKSLENRIQNLLSFITICYPNDTSLSHPDYIKEKFNIISTVKDFPVIDHIDIVEDSIKKYKEIWEYSDNDIDNIFYLFKKRNSSFWERYEDYIGPLDTISDDLSCLSIHTITKDKIEENLKVIFKSEEFKVLKRDRLIKGLLE